MCKCLWNMCASEHYMGSWKLCKHHCCDNCLLLAHEFLKIQNWLNVLRFVSEIHICSCYFRLFLHAFHESAYGIFDSASIFRSAFCQKTYIFKCNVSFTALVLLAARLEPYTVTKVSHCILIFHSVSTLSLPVHRNIYTHIYIYINYTYIYI